MQRFVALLLILLFASAGAHAGVNSHQLKVSGNSAGKPPEEATGFMDQESQDQLIFRYKAGKNGDVGKFPEGTFELPYGNVTRFVYGNVKHLRVGQTLALAALAGVGGLLLLLSKSHTHYLSIDYKDSEAHAQVISFEVGKDAVRPLINALELRTGKKVEYEATGKQSRP